jgi:hypothetical protein
MKKGKNLENAASASYFYDAIERRMALEKIRLIAG